MTSPREGPNPLRPYYIPPSVSATADFTRRDGAATIVGRNAASTTHSLGSSARNILSDMDYSDYLPDSSPSSSDMVKHLIEQALWKYTSVFLAQPFDVAKTVLQVHLSSKGLKGPAKIPVPVEDARRRPSTYSRDSLENFSEDSDLDSPSYFTSSHPLSHTPSRRSRARRRRRTSPSPDGIPRVHAPQSPPRKAKSAHTLELHSSSSVLSCLSTLWNEEGAWGIWKGTNSTYIHSLLLSTLTSFLRSFLSALFALPDPGVSFAAISPSPTAAGGIDILSSPAPLGSLFVSVSAAGLAGVFLAPLDIARIRLMLTPSTHPPRSILATLYTLPSWILPLSLAPVTILHSTIPTFISASTPLFLRSKLGIDPFLTPNLYSISTFCSQVFELAIKLPIETVLRRGQMAVTIDSAQGKQTPTVVEIGPYKGIYGTMRSIVYEEGESSGPAELIKASKAVPATTLGKVGQEKRGKGQGLEGLWRGWRVGMWGLVGVWGAATLGGAGSKAGEF